MAAITLRCGGLTSDEINISAGTAEIGQLTVSSGPTITAISGDASMSAANDSTLATGDAIAAYIAERDAATLAAAAEYTNDRTGGSYYNPFFLASESDTNIIRLRSTDSDTLSLAYSPYGYDVVTNPPSVPININSAITASDIHISSAKVRKNDGNYRWSSESVDPQPIAGIPGPQVRQTGSWATYAFAPETDSTYFANVMVPFTANHDNQPSELRLYIRYSMGGASMEPITFRTTYQRITAGEILGATPQSDTILTPNGANVMCSARLAMPDIVTASSVGAQLALSFARIGRNSPNPDYLFVWDISLMYDHAVWGVYTEDI